MTAADNALHALRDAAQSLETLATLSGRKTWGDTTVPTHIEKMADVRGYAASRAAVARAALAECEAEQAAAPKAKAVSDQNELADALDRFHSSTPVWAAEDRALLKRAAEALRAAPQPPAEREPLTDAQCDKLIADNGLGYMASRSTVTRAVLIGLCRAAHGIGTK